MQLFLPSRLAFSLFFVAILSLTSCSANPPVQTLDQTPNGSKESASVVADDAEEQNGSQTPSDFSNWKLPRGNPQATGATEQSLAENLEVKWQYQADEAIETTPIVAGEMVFTADVMGKVYAVDRRNGQEIWKHDFDTGFLASPAISGDRLFAGDIDGNLYAMQSSTGDVLWQTQTNGEISGSPAFFKDQVLVTSHDGNLYSFKAADGSALWTYETDDQIRCSPTIAGNRTFLGGCDGALHSIDLDAGRATDQPFPLGGPTGSTPAVQGENAFLPIMDGVLLALNWKTQQPVWEYVDEERRQEYRSSVAVAGDTLILSSQNKQVDAISIKTGKRKWRYTLRRRADASPVIAGDDVWIASTDGRLVRLSLQDGAEKWSYEIRGSFIGSPAIAGGELFIGDDKGVLRCLAPSGS